MTKNPKKGSIYFLVLSPALHVSSASHARYPQVDAPVPSLREVPLEPGHVRLTVPLLQLVAHLLELGGAAGNGGGVPGV